MATSINCCIKLSLPPSPPFPSSSLPKSAATPLSTSKDWWRSRCISTVACAVIIGSTASFTVCSSVDDGIALAGDMSFVISEHEAKVVRWSEKRKCPPWNPNSLENIVPENLPRPSAAGRRSAGVVSHETAPPVGALVRYRSGCFAL